MAAFQDRLGWYVGASAYWFSTSAKYFILLLSILPGQVKALSAEGTENATWGTVVMIGTIWAIFGPAIFGHISDRLGRRKPFIAIGAALTVIALAVLMNANSLGVIIAGYLLLQFSDDFGQGALQAIIPERVPIELRGKASGVMAMLEQGAQLFIGLYAFGVTKVAGEAAVPTIYVTLALLNILCALMTLRTLAGAEKLVQVEAARAPGSIANFFKSWLAPWRSSDFSWVWGTKLLNAVGFYCAQLYLRNYLDASVGTFGPFGDNVDLAVIVLGLTISLSAVFGALWSARSADRIGRKKVIYIAGTAMSLLLIPFALVPIFTVIWGLAALFGIGYGAYLGATWALVSDVLPSADSLGTDMGIWAAGLTVGQMIAGGAGHLVDALNRNQAGLGYTVVFLIGGAMFFLSTVFVRFIKGST